MEVEFDPKVLIGSMNDLIKVQLPKAAKTSLNQALFETRKRLQDEAKMIFDNPVPFTIRSFLYDRPVQADGDLKARVFVRDDGPKGNAPSRYLDPQIRGGPAYVTRFQRSLLSTIVRQIDGRTTQAAQRGTLLRPTRSEKVRRNKYGNMSPGQYNQILSAIKGGKSSADFQEVGAVPFSMDRRYIYLDNEALDDPYFARRFTTYARKPGIYKPELVEVEPGRKQTRFYRVMTQGTVPTYSAKFRFFDLSRQTIESEFTQRLRSQILR
jgi:hypothetical protein